MPLHNSNALGTIQVEFRRFEIQQFGKGPQELWRLIPGFTAVNYTRNYNYSRLRFRLGLHLQCSNNLLGIYLFIIVYYSSYGKISEEDFSPSLKLLRITQASHATVYAIVILNR